MSLSPQEPVSICLLTYKRADVLSRSLDSLLAQTHTNFELIINDDCSPDHTAKVGRAYERRDNRVRYVRNEKNLRYAGNQNAALARAQHDLVAIVHDGDIYQPACVEKWVDALRSHPQAGLVFNASDSLDAAGEVAVQYRHPYPATVAGGAMVDEMLRLYSSPIFGIVMLRKQVALAVGEFDTGFPILADVDMWFRILLRADVAYINEPLYQIYPRESDHVNSDVNWKIILEQYRIFARNAARRHPAPPGRQRALRQVRRHFRRKVVQSCLWAAKRGRWKLATEGIRYFFRREEPDGPAR